MDGTGIICLAAAGVCFAMVELGLMRGRILGIAFRSRLIARRELEPALFWASLTIFAALGALLTYAVVSVELFGR